MTVREETEQIERKILMKKVLPLKFLIRKKNSPYSRERNENLVFRFFFIFWKVNKNARKKFSIKIN